MALPTRVRIAGILAISLLMLSAPGALAVGATYQPDALIRHGSYGSSQVELGAGILNTTGLDQTYTETGPAGSRTSFRIAIKNGGDVNDSYKVRRSAGYTNGYRVRYYNAAGTDVTGQVSVGSFTTPSLAPGAEYVMRATIQIRSLATVGSSTSRLITVRSVQDPLKRDAVKFTVALGAARYAFALSPATATGGFIAYEFDFGTVAAGTTQTFKVKNEGTGNSAYPVGVEIYGPFALSNDTCSDQVLQMAATCSFQVTFTPPADCDAAPFSQVQNFVERHPGPPSLYFHFTLKATCPPAV